MTTPTTNSTNESPMIGSRSNAAASTPATVIYKEFSAARPLPLPNTVSLDAMVAEFEKNPDIANRLADARRKLAEELYGERSQSLSALRLAAGFSQAQLAARCGTTQPYLSKIEMGKTDPSTDIIARIARALSVDEQRVYHAIRQLRQERRSVDD